VGAELSASSATCCSRVLQLRAARRGFAGEAPCCIPSCTSARPPWPGATRFLAPVWSTLRAAGSAGTPIRLPSMARWREGRQGAARPASPLGKSSGSLLLANANTALFFPDRANAPGTRAATHGAPAERSASLGKAPGVQKPPLGKFPRRPATRGAPAGPQGSGLAAEAANAHSGPRGPPKRRAAGKSGVPTRGGGRRGAGGLRSPRAFPQRRRHWPPPLSTPRGRAGELSSPGAGPRRPAAQPRAGGKHEACSSGTPREAERGALRQVWGRPGDR
jgi:hypothetical protein